MVGLSPLNSRYGSQESVRLLSTNDSMSYLFGATANGRESVMSSQKKKGIKSSIGRFFSKKEKVGHVSVSNVNVLENNS